MLIKEGKAVVGLNNVAAAETRVEQGASKITKEAKRAEAELDRFAKTTTRINTTPLERYHAQLQRLDQALNRGKISQETYARAVMRANAELHKAREAASSVAGPGPLQMVGAMAAGYLTLSRAVGVVADAFRHARQQSEGALGTLRGLDDERRALAQLAIGEKPGTLTTDLKRADAAAMASGASRATSLRVLHAAKSMGFEQDFEEVMGMHPILDASAGSVIAGKVRQMTGNKHTPRQLANILIEAGKPSEVDAETLAGPMAIALEGGRRIGATAEQTAAMLSAATIFYAGRGEDQSEGKTGAARVAGDRIRAFSHKVATRLPEVAAKQPDLFGAFEAVRGLSDIDRAEFLQENEEIASIYESYLQFREQGLRTLSKVKEAGAAPPESDNIAQGLRIRAADPTSRAAIELNRAEITREAGLEGGLGVSTAERKSLTAIDEAGLVKAGFGVGARGGYEQGKQLAEFLGLDPQAGRLTARMGGAIGLTFDYTPLGQLTRLFTNNANDARLQRELLQQIRDRLSPDTGGVGRAESAGARAPLN
jgi:hypothetical protein